MISFNGGDRVAIEQINAPTGVEQTTAVPRQEQQTETPVENTEDTNLSETDVVTISPEAQDINARTADNPNTAPAASTDAVPLDGAEENTHERDVEQDIRENQDNATRASSQPPQRTNNVDEVV